MCDDDITVEQFCRRFVEPMGEESDHVHIVALTDALLVRSAIFSENCYLTPWCLASQSGQVHSWVDNLKQLV